MKKILRVSFMALVTLMGSSAMAQTEFDFDAGGASMFGLPGESCSANASQGIEASDAGDINADVSTSKGDFTITVSAGVADPESGKVKTPNRIWNSAPKLRLYSGTLTIASKGAAITKVEFVLASQASKAKWSSDNSASTGTLDTSTATNKVWTGSTKSLVITIAANTQISKIIINGGATPEPTVIDATVAEALAVINGLEDGAMTTDEYKVTGYVVGTPDFQRDKENNLYGNVNLEIADEAGGTTTLTIYRAWKYAYKNKFTEDDLNMIKEGDKVVFQGVLQKFVKDGVMTPELSNGYLVSVTTGIHAVTIDDANAPAYSLDGRRVNSNYHGVVIKNGKKVMMK